jgi:hypothetical protein
MSSQRLTLAGFMRDALAAAAERTPSFGRPWPSDQLADQIDAGSVARERGTQLIGVLFQLILGSILLVGTILFYYSLYDSFSRHGKDSDFVPWIVGAALLGAAGAMVYQFLDDRTQGAPSAGSESTDEVDHASMPEPGAFASYVEINDRRFEILEAQVRNLQAQIQTSQQYTSPVGKEPERQRDG